MTNKDKLPEVDFEAPPLNQPNAKTYNSYDEIRTDLAKGVDIYWHHEGYKVFFSNLMRPSEVQLKMGAVKDNKMIVCRCLENWFGGVLGESEIKYCYSN